MLKEPVSCVKPMEVYKKIRFGAISGSVGTISNLLEMSGAILPHRLHKLWIDTVGEVKFSTKERFKRHPICNIDELDEYDRLKLKEFASLFENN